MAPPLGHRSYRTQISWRSLAKWWRMTQPPTQEGLRIPNPWLASLVWLAPAPESCGIQSWSSKCWWVLLPWAEDYDDVGWLDWKYLCWWWWRAGEESNMEALSSVLSFFGRKHKLTCNCQTLIHTELQPKIPFHFLSDFSPICQDTKDKSCSLSLSRSKML